MHPTRNNVKDNSSLSGRIRSGREGTPSPSLDQHGYATKKLQHEDQTFIDDLFSEERCKGSPKDSEDSKKVKVSTKQSSPEKEHPTEPSEQVNEAKVVVSESAIPRIPPVCAEHSTNPNRKRNTAIYDIGNDELEKPSSSSRKLVSEIGSTTAEARRI